MKQWRLIRPPLRVEGLLLHCAVGQDATLQPVRLFVAVAVAGRQVNAPGVVVRIKTRAGVAQRIVMGDATGVDMRFIGITREAHFEAATVAGFAVVVTIIVCLAIARGYWSAGASVVIAVVGVIMAKTIGDFVSGAGAEFHGETIGVSAGAVGVVFALAIVDSAAVSAAALQFNAGIGVVLGPAGFDIHIVAVNVKTVIRSFDREPGKFDVALARIHHETVLCIVRKRKCRRPADRHAAGHVYGLADRVSARNINRRSRCRILDGVTNIGFCQVRAHCQDCH